VFVRVPKHLFRAINDEIPETALRQDRSTGSVATLDRLRMKQEQQQALSSAARYHAKRDADDSTMAMREQANRIAEREVAPLLKASRDTGSQLDGVRGRTAGPSMFAPSSTTTASGSAHSGGHRNEETVSHYVRAATMEGSHYDIVAGLLREEMDTSMQRPVLGYFYRGASDSYAPSGAELVAETIDSVYPSGVITNEAFSRLFPTLADLNAADEATLWDYRVLASLKPDVVYAKEQMLRGVLENAAPAAAPQTDPIREQAAKIVAAENERKQLFESLVSSLQNEQTAAQQTS